MDVTVTYKSQDNKYRILDLTSFTFPGGELHFKVSEGDAHNAYAAKYAVIDILVKSTQELFAIALIRDILLRRDIKDIRLFLGYIPYARQDRVCVEGEAFSLKVFADYINSLNFTKVYVDDPHSDVASALINNVVVKSQLECFIETFDCCSNPACGKGVSKYTVISPDAGANKKIAAIAKHLDKDDFIRADKVRNISTGEIIQTVVYGDVQGQDCLIVDDICDGGATFIFLAKELKKKGAKSVALYVTHGIFSKGKQVLYDAGIDEVFACWDWEKVN